MKRQPNNTEWSMSATAIIRSIVIVLMMGHLWDVAVGIQKGVVRVPVDFVSIGCLVILIASVVCRKTALWTLTLLIMVYQFVRMISLAIDDLLNAHTLVPITFYMMLSLQVWGITVAVGSLRKIRQSRQRILYGTASSANATEAA